MQEVPFNHVFSILHVDFCQQKNGTVTLTKRYDNNRQSRHVQGNILFEFYFSYGIYEKLSCSFIFNVDTIKYSYIQRNSKITLSLIVLLHK